MGNKIMNKNIDKSWKIENKDGNIIGNVLGDESNIEGNIIIYFLVLKIEKFDKFGWLDFLIWV